MGARLGSPVEEAIAAGDVARAEELRLAFLAPLGTDGPAGRRIRQIAIDNIHEVTMDESGRIRLDPPAFERLEEIVAPTLVLPAEHDLSYMRRLCRILTERIPRARFSQIPETDHVLNMRQPGEFNRVVLEFLRDVL